MTTTVPSGVSLARYRQYATDDLTIARTVAAKALREVGVGRPLQGMLIQRLTVINYVLKERA